MPSRQKSIKVHLCLLRKLHLWVINVGLPTSPWFLNCYHIVPCIPVAVRICAWCASFISFHSTHTGGLQAPSACQDVHLASVLPVTSSSLVTQRCFWHSHLQVWSGVKEDVIPKWHCCHLRWTSCSWHMYTQQQCTACSSKAIGTRVRAKDRGSDNRKYSALSPKTSRA